MTGKAGQCLVDPKRSVPELLVHFDSYRRERQRLLRDMERPDSQRDPLSEFAEHLVAALLGGKLACSPVQQGWDLKRPNGSRVQVKYLANPSMDQWPNEHEVRFPAQADEYALVVFVALAPQWVFVFKRGQTEPIYELLKKRHKDRESTLQLTRKNVRAIAGNPAVFEGAGMRLFLLTECL